MSNRELPLSELIPEISQRLADRMERLSAASGPVVQSDFADDPMASMSSEERAVHLSALERRELQRLLPVLEGVTKDRKAAEKIVASLSALIFARVSSYLKSSLEAVAISTASTVVEFVHGDAQGFYLKSSQYGDWIANSSGVVFLEPERDFTLRFANQLRLQFLFSPTTGPENDIDLSLKPGGYATILIGEQDEGNFFPVTLDLALSDADVQFLAQLQATPGTGKAPLRLDYATFWRHG